MIHQLIPQLPLWLIPFVEATGLFIIVWSVFAFIRKPLARLSAFVARPLSSLWGRPLVDTKLIARLLPLLPVLAFMFASRLIEDLPPTLSILIERLSLSTTLILLLRAITTLLDNLNEAYSTLEVAKNRPIKGFIQVVLILLYLLTGILTISILIDRSPWIFLSGLGAMTAVLLLVFRDTLLSLVAGLQLTSNNYVRVGDWIEMPQFGADGDVIDIALHAVRVANWDKTITVIPTHKFLEHSFKNWRGMQESGGRRIKRSLLIDMTSIQFLSNEQIEKYKRFALLQDYIGQKVSELKEHNARYADHPELIVNSRRLTNVGTFRAYLVNYLKQHPQISKNLTFIVRQLAPTPQGLPIEIYVFTTDTRWVIYEGIQADIFDHVIAITQEFGLRIFQEPTGNDMREIAVRK